MKGATLRRAGVLAGLLVGPFFLISVGLNTWASTGYLHGLGWQFVGGGQVPWPSRWRAGRNAVGRKLRPSCYGLADCDPRRCGGDRLPCRRASSFAVVLLAMLGVALILAAFRVDVPMLVAGVPPAGMAGCTGSRSF